MKTAVIENWRFLIIGLLVVGITAFGLITLRSGNKAVSTTSAGQGILSTGGDATWPTYRNQDLGYEISYPPGWSIEVRDPRPGDGFVYQYFRATNGDAAIQVAVNLQGGWCEGPITIGTIDPITVSGIEGMAMECPQDLQIVWDFRGAKGQNYTVLGNYEDDPETIRRAVESFRFLE